MTGDDPADAAVAEFFEATEANHSDLFRRLVSASAGVVADEDLPGIGAFARREEDWPEWANPDLGARRPAGVRRVRSPAGHGPVHGQSSRRLRLLQGGPGAGTHGPPDPQSQAPVRRDGTDDHRRDDAGGPRPRSGRLSGRPSRPADARRGAPRADSTSTRSSWRESPRSSPGTPGSGCPSANCSCSGRSSPSASRESKLSGGRAFGSATTRRRRTSTFGISSATRSASSRISSRSRGRTRGPSGSNGGGASTGRLPRARS